MREWFIEVSEFESDEDFRVAVERELAGLENMGHRLGRGFVVTPIRRARRVGNAEVFETIGWGFSEAVMPAVREMESVAEAARDELSPEELAEHFPEQEPVEA